MRDVGLDLLVGDLREAHPGRGGAGDPDLAMRVDHAVAGVQRPGASAHLLPASGRLGSRPGLAEDLGRRARARSRSRSPGIAGWCAATATALSCASLSAYGAASVSSTPSSSTPETMTSGRSPARLQGLQPGGRRGRQDQPGERSGHGSPLARQAPEPWRSVVADPPGGRRPLRASVVPVAAASAPAAAIAETTATSAATSSAVASPLTMRSRGGLDRLDRRGSLGGLGHSGMFPCFLGGSVSRLEAQQPQRPDDLDAGLVRGDHGVDVAALGRDVGVGERVLVLRDQLGARSSSRGPSAAPSSLRYRMLAAPWAPMTAIWAVGQARLMSAPRCLDPITSYAPP